MKNIKITIPQPCHENWNEMTPAEKGRFCAVCQKTVIDFTKSTDKQIAETFATTPQLCGRFLTSQLDRDLVVQNERKSFWLASLFFGCISLTNFKAQAQGEPRKTVITEATKKLS
ncbi:hypothetical protein JJC03_07390 [Flavobacterium oreochromis]|uniref:hypothetical protein n=1 Tax=Flavobacterium oreochromis TaxID=2906078 RepID=UPI001CE6E961|nr:hypothetical protein [Flavobacterium oreochromis]QYS87625.1 hypothetical protein JJC03_07390 [Flavobacterium oreochromis]